MKRFVLPRWLRFLVFAFLTLAVLAALAYPAIDLWGRSRWAAAQEQLHAKGESLVWAELAAPPIADHENFFAVPLFETLRAEVAEESHPEGSDETAPKALAAAKEMVSQVRKGLQKDRESSLPPQLDVEAAAEALRKAGLASAESPAMDQVARAFRLVDASLSDLYAAAERPGSQFLPREEPSLTTPLPHISALLSLGQFLRAQAMVEAMAGNSGKAVGSSLMLLRLARALEGEPLLITELVRYAILDLAASTVQYLLAQGNLTDAQIVDLQDAFSNVTVLPGLARAIRGERTFLTGTLLPYARKGGIPDLLKTISPNCEAVEEEESSLWKDLPTRLVWQLHPKGLLYEDAAYGSLKYQEIIEIFEGPGDHLAKLEAFERSLREERDSVAGKLHLFSHLAFPSITGAWTVAFRCETRCRQVELACALAGYQRARGAYPRALSALVPEFIASVPEDPVTGEPMKYRLEKPGYLLWSIGANRVDDDATPHPLTRRDEGDWVWQG